MENSKDEKTELESVIDRIKLLKTPVVTAVKKNFHFEDFLCGWGAAVINISVTYPINKVIFRQMLSNLRLTTAISEIYREGFYYLYRGILPPLIQKSISLSLMFGVYENCRRPLLSMGVNEPISCVTSGIIAGSAEAILMPFERVQTLLADNHYHKKFKNMSHAFKVIHIEYGYRELYRGMIPILLRNGPSNALFFLIREQVVDDSNIKLQVSNVVGIHGSDFLCGALIGVFVSTVFFPLNVIKINAQRILGGEFHSFSAVFKEVYYERNKSIINIYRGCATNGTRSFFSWGIINASYRYLTGLWHANVDS